jgi:hypothetical protein
MPLSSGTVPATVSGVAGVHTYTDVNDLAVTVKVTPTVDGFNAEIVEDPAKANILGAIAAYKTAVQADPTNPMHPTDPAKPFFSFTLGGSSKGGKSKKARRTKGGKSKKARKGKSLRRK